MKQEEIPDERPDVQNGRAIVLEADAPVKSYRVKRNRKCAQPERQDVDGHAESRPDL